VRKKKRTRVKDNEKIHNTAKGKKRNKNKNIKSFKKIK
jgi:hypothetical protein